MPRPLQASAPRPASRLIPRAALQALLPHADDRRRAVHAFADPAAMSLHPAIPPQDALLVSPGSPTPEPATVFDHLRWGGVALVLARSPREAEARRHAFASQPGFRIETAPLRLPRPRGWPFVRSRLAFVARKILLDRPETMTARFSYHLALEPAQDQPAGLAVVKRVPTIDQAVARLLAVDPTADPAHAERVAVGLVRKALPLFLTREAAFLKILRKRLPEPFRPRVPEALDLQTDDQGHVQSLTMTWLRQGLPLPDPQAIPLKRDGPALILPEPLSLLTFARQAAQLIDALHTHVRVMHLDLRLDNIVVTPHGVGVVDFGSAIRFGEDISESRVLAKVFERTLTASQLAADLRRLRRRRLATSPVFDGCFPRADPAIDLFALALQMTRPHDNPDLLGLVDADTRHPDHARLAQLRRDILNPVSPSQPRYRTVADVAGELGRGV